MQRNSMLYDQYANQVVQNPEPVSTLRASIDPRFNRLLARAANYRERASQQQVSPTTNLHHSPSVVTNNSNAWLPLETSTEKVENTEK
jgi:hypothetical protein